MPACNILVNGEKDTSALRNNKMSILYITPTHNIGFWNTFF